MRAYELMIICQGELEESAVQLQINEIQAQVEAADATIASTDKWGKRRFAYQINHKDEGWYVVFEVLAEGGALDALDRNLRLADEIVRHKLMRLPDSEATKRGLFGGPKPAEAPIAASAE
ncbi:MAG: 30S ribosomal protein S6 [Acidimicrobiales bacterium]